MTINKINIKENTTLSIEDFEEIYGRKPEILKLTSKRRERDYHEYARSDEAFFGENNIYKTTMINLMGELRYGVQHASDISKKRSERKEFISEIEATVKKIEKHIEKTFNIEKCFFGLFDDLNAFCYPMIIDSNLVTKKDNKTVVNEKVKISLEDIVETKTGYKYKDPKGKKYCLSFGVHFFDKKNGKDIYTDEECAAVVTHELGHAMQQAVCSINQNLASVYIKAMFDDAYLCLNPILGILTLGLSSLVSIKSHKLYKEMQEEDPEDLGDEIIVQGIGASKKAFDRDEIGSRIENGRERTEKEMMKNKDNKISKFFIKFFSFVFGGVFKISFEILNSLISIPQYIYASTQSKFLNKNRRFEQFADIYTSSYGLGPAQASALSKLGNTYGDKQDYGILSILNYVPVLNILTGVSHYMNESFSSLVAGYPDTKGRIVAMYKALDSELNSNTTISAADKKAIKDEIDRMNSIYNDYVFDWSPKGFVYALWHKVTFKNLKNEKSDVSENVLEALQDMEKEKKFKDAKSKNENKDKININLDSKKLLSTMLNVIKNLKINYGISTSKIVEKIEPELRSI